MPLGLSRLGDVEGRWLVTGLPGSGKTTLLRDRFVALVEAGADPERIALFCLTSRAARRLRRDIASRLARPLPDLGVFTVHGFCFWVLADRFDELGYAAPPVVMSAAEQHAAVAALLAGESDGLWPHHGGLLKNRAFARDVAAFVLRAQEQLLDAAALTTLASERDLPEYEEIARFLDRYLAATGDGGRVDFGGVVQQAAALLQRTGDARFDHVLVDDYQDVSPAAEAVYAVLASTAASVVVAADPGGSVFSFRGLDAGPLGRVRDTMGPLAEEALTGSHRATGGAARAMDERAEAAVPGVEARSFLHPGEEAEAIAREILRIRVDEGVAWKDVAVVLRRYSAFLPVLRHALVRHGVPHAAVAESATLADEPAVRPVLDLIRYALRPAERQERLEPVLASPIAGFTPHEVRRLRRDARVRGVALRDLVESEAGVEDDMRDRLKRFRALLTWVEDAAATATPDEVFFGLWERVPWFAGLVEVAERDPNARRSLDALTAFARMLGRFTEREPRASFAAFLDMIEAADFGPDPWFLPGGGDEDAVAILTAHHAHGREFEVAIVANCLEGEFPTLTRPQPIVALERLLGPASESERRSERFAEERRVFRLAVTRACSRTLLFSSAASTARTPRTPSRYAARLGLSWQESRPDGKPVNARSLEAFLRASLADSSASEARRLAALEALRRSGADPRGWWGRREWTDPDVSLYAEGVFTSYSRMAPLDNCALQFLYASEMGLDTRETHYMWLGSLVHDIIERVHKGDLPRDSEAVLAALDASWKTDVFGVRAVEHRRYLDAREMLKRWLTRREPDPVAAEAPFAFELNGAMVRGRIDAIFPMDNGHVRVVDYKTGRSRNANGDLQLATYYLAMVHDETLRGYGEPGLLELHFIAQKRSRDPYMVVTAKPRTETDYRGDAESRLGGLIDRMRSEQFAPDPGADCMWCAFKTLCPLWAEGAEATA